MAIVQRGGVLVAAPASLAGMDRQSVSVSVGDIGRWWDQAHETSARRQAF